MPNSLAQKLIFILGKGGVGRTSVASALAWNRAQAGEKVLVVQWALHDAIGPRFGLQPCSHRAVPLRPHLFFMNFSSDEAIREYFVDHLGLRMLYKLVVENRHVQRLIHAAPGIQELFFLGRLFWLVELAAAERGLVYDRIIVDAPATGHGFSLFSVAPTVASFGVAGPLAKECERVAKLLSDPSQCALLCVTLPEELPVEETLEFLPKLRQLMPHNPLRLLMNRSASGALLPPGAARPSSLEQWGAMEPHPFSLFLKGISSPVVRQSCQIVADSLFKRIHLESMFFKRLESLAGEFNLTEPMVLGDQTLLSNAITDAEVIMRLSGEVSDQWFVTKGNKTGVTL